MNWLKDKWNWLEDLLRFNIKKSLLGSGVLGWLTSVVIGWLL